YRGNRLPLNIKGKAVIVVNDGLLTGATMRAAVSALEKHQPAARIVAVPVSSFSAFDDVGAVVDEIVCLHTPAEFESIGEFYQEYPDVSDDEVASILASAKAP
ncbi:MAG: phosphoribosyltransferase family protein, partial [Thermoanaerobaculia bacterium]|nr:phosphoribosyltransferase family protein [Thermoanaerobaculia bacterium]